MREKSGEPREKSRTRSAVDLGKKRIKLWGRGSICGANCDKITYYQVRCALPGWPAAAHHRWSAETVTAYDASTDVPRSSREQAQKEGEALLLQTAEGADWMRTPARDGERPHFPPWRRETHGWWWTLRAECLEQIGREVPLTKECSWQRIQLRRNAQWNSASESERMEEASEPVRLL